MVNTFFTKNTKNNHLSNLFNHDSPSLTHLMKSGTRGICHPWNCFCHSWNDSREGFLPIILGRDMAIFRHFTCQICPFLVLKIVNFCFAVKSSNCACVASKVCSEISAASLSVSVGYF